MESYAASHQLSRTIDVIYDCVLEPRKWPRAIQAVAEVMDSSFGMLCRASPSLGTVQAIYHWGMDIDRFREMATTWGDQLTGRSYIATAPILKPFGLEYVQQTTNTDDFWQQPFFTDWFRPSGYGDSANLVLYRTEHRALTFSMITRANEPKVSRRSLQRLGLLAPHLQRAVLLGEHIDRQNLAMSRHEKLLDALSFAVIIMDHRGQVQHANVAANSLLQRGDAMRISTGRLELVGMSVETARLHEAIQSVAGKGQGSELESLPVFLQSGVPGIAYVLPLRFGDVSRPTGTGTSVAMVLCIDTHATAPAEVVANLYGLTDAEARVLEQIGSGKNRPQTALALNVANSTVKSHLDRIFDKTGMASQAELMQCLARLAAPITNA